MIKCYCHSFKEYSQCCEPLIKGASFAATPEQLMRSRYTAFVLADIDYLKSTMKNPALKKFDEEETKEWAEHMDWKGLQVIYASKVEESDTQAFVEFIATVKHCNQLHNMRELSEFRRDDGKWYYVDSKPIDEPKSSSKKIGRNDPCPCGSHKKYKKCCGAK